MDTCDGSRSSGRQLLFPKMHDSTCDQVVSEWKTCISKVDNTMTSLANALDTMHVMVNTATGNKRDHTLQEEPGDKQLDELHSLHNLLICVEGAVLHDGKSAISIVTDFIHTVINAVSQIGGTSEKEFEPLSLDKHKKLDIDSSNCQVRNLEMIKRENYDLKEELRRVQRHNSVITDMESELLKENDNLRDKTKNLEKCKKQLEEQNKKIEVRESELEKDLTKLRVNYKDSGLTKMSIEVLEKKNKDMMIKYSNLEKEHADCKKSESRSKYISKEEHEKNIADLTMEVDILNNSIEAKVSEINANEVSIEKFSQRIKQLEKDLEVKNSLIASYETKIQEKETDKQKFQTEKYLLSARYNDSLSKCNIEKETIRKRNEEDAITIKMLNKQIEENRRKMEDYEKINYELKERCNSANETMKTKDHEMDNLKTKFKQLAVFENENMELKANLKNREGELRKLSVEKDSLRKDLYNEKTAHQQLLKKNTDQCQQIEALSTEKDDLQKCLNGTKETVQRLTSENERLAADISIMYQELEMYKRKRLIQVQLYYQRRGELITTVEEELTRILKQRIEISGKIEIEFVKCLHTSDVNPQLPLLLLCISASRIGTDAANTVHGLQLTSRMSLLIFHHKDVHALPSQASYQVLTGEEFKAMSGIFDLAFLSGKGIYSCPLNDSSIDKIVSFINTDCFQGSADGLSR